MPDYSISRRLHPGARQRSQPDRRRPHLDRRLHRLVQSGAGRQSGDGDEFAEYEKLFGGLIARVPLAYAVNHFFLNGGTQAYIVRLYDDAGAATSAKWASNTIAGLTLYASNPGRWANALCVAVSNVVAAPGGHASFDLRVSRLAPAGAPSAVENYASLSTDPANPQWAVRPSMGIRPS